MAHLAAADLRRSNSNYIVRVLRGGNQSWQQSDYPVIDGMDRLLSEIDDIWDRPMIEKPIRNKE